MEPVTTALLPDLVPLQRVANELGMVAWRLALLSREGKFPRLLKVTQKRCFVSRAELDSWLAGRWTGGAAADAEAAPAPTPKPARRRRASR